MKIRRATADDSGSMAELDRIVFTIPWSIDAFRTEFDYDGAVYYIAFENDEIAGYAGMRTVCGEGHITNIAVHPDHRRIGLGTELVMNLFAEGLDAYTLEVRKSNDPAIAMYRSLGFREEGIRKRYYSDNGEDAVIMWKRI